MASEPEYDRPPPGILFRSFLLIGGSLMGLLVATMLTVFVVGKTSFPDAAAHWEQGTDHVRSQLENEPESILPTRLCWIAIGAQAVYSFLAGMLVCRFAPFASVAHSAFLAVVVAVFYLQMSMTRDNHVPDWFVVSLMIVSPIMILLGGQFLDRFVYRRQRVEESHGDAE